LKGKEAKHGQRIPKNREELIFVLSEASQLEHMIMCQYLFASFTLKVGPSEALSPFQLEAISGWERSISAIAVQEMIHLSIVSIAKKLQSQSKSIEYIRYCQSGSCRIFMF